MQEGLLPAPFVVGRGDHYGAEHLARLVAVRQLQEAGQTLDEIRRRLTPGEGPGMPEPPATGRALYRRLRLAPGVELHLASDVRLPSETRLNELAKWCRLHLRAGSARQEED